MCIRIPSDSVGRNHTSASLFLPTLSMPILFASLYCLTVLPHSLCSAVVFTAQKLTKTTMAQRGRRAQRLKSRTGCLPACMGNITEATIHQGAGLTFRSAEVPMRIGTRSLFGASICTSEDTTMPCHHEFMTTGSWQCTCISVTCPTQ